MVIGFGIESKFNNHLVNKFDCNIDESIFALKIQPISVMFVLFFGKGVGFKVAEHGGIMVLVLLLPWIILLYKYIVYRYIVI